MDQSVEIGGDPPRRSPRESQETIGASLRPGRAHLTFAFKKLYGPFMLFRSFPGFKGSEVLSTTGRQILLSGIEPILT